MQMFGQPWLKCLLVWTVQQVKDEMISKRHKAKIQHSLYILNNINHIHLLHFLNDSKGLATMHIVPTVSQCK